MLNSITAGEDSGREGLLMEIQYLKSLVIQKDILVEEMRNKNKILESFVESLQRGGVCGQPSIKVNSVKSISDSINKQVPSYSSVLLLKSKNKVDVTEALLNKTDLKTLNSVRVI